MEQAQQKVRPRQIWAGVGLMILAMVVIGVFNIAGSTIGQVIGLVLLLVGGAASLSGQVMRDVHGVRVETIHVPEVADEPDSRPRPSLLLSRAEIGSAAVVGLVVVGIWLVLSRRLLGVPFEAETSGASTRDFAIAIVVVMAVLLLRQHGPNYRRTRFAAGVCAFCGVLLIAFSLIASFSDQTQQVNELVCGVALVVLAAATMLRPVTD